MGRYTSIAARHRACVCARLPPKPSCDRTTSRRALLRFEERMLKLNDHPALRLHVGDVLLTALREMDSLLPVCWKFILPSSMPFCFRLPPRIADANTSVRPVPDFVIAALGNHGSPARWACSGKPRLSLATLAFNGCELHSLSCPQPQSGAIVTANRGALEGTFDVRSGCAPWQGGAFQWVQVPPGERSSRKQPEQLWRRRNS